MKLRTGSASIGAALLAAGLFIASVIVAPPSARAADPEARIIPDSELNFGTFMVFGSGSRTINANGAVSDISIVSLEGNSPAPGRFTVLYDRGNNSRHTLDVELELVMSPVSPVRIDGVRGRLSAFETDLPQALRIAPGQAIRISLPNCRTKICSKSFRLGARLDVSRDYGGANLVVPVPFDVTVVSVNRENPGGGKR